MYKFKLPIGDWSNDGHEKCDYYIIQSNISAKELVPIYIAMDEKYQISKECSEYEDNKLSEDFIKLIYHLDLDVKKYITSEKWGIINSEELAQLILDLLMKFEPNLTLSIVPEDTLPEFNNWLGQKFKGISSGSVIDLPGYGLFE